VLIQPLDMGVIVVYLLGITSIGVLASRQSTTSSQGYFLAGRSLRWPAIGLSLFATNISTVHLIGLAADGFHPSKGMAVGNFEWLAAFCLILLALVFAPFYHRSNVATLPEYLEKRYGPGSRTLLAFFAIVGALFIHIGVAIYAGAVVIKSLIGFEVPAWYMPYNEMLEFNTGAAILVVSVLTVVYTVTGGLKAVVITESIQTVVLLLGSLAITVFGILALRRAGITDYATLSQRVEVGQLSMIRTDGDYAWYAMLLGYPVLGIWYWCSDQTIVQRVLGARSERDAQLGPIFAGFLKTLPVLLMVFPGVIAYVLFRDKVAENPDGTLVVLIQQLLPTGLQGLVVAGLLAALMSTVAGALNSSATLVSIDIVKRMRPQTPDRTLVRIGQATAVVVMIAAVAWSTQGDRFGGIFGGINHMISVLAPPISVVFIWGVFWKRGTAQASLATLVIGFLLGATVFVVDFPAVALPLLGYQLFTEKCGIPFLLQAWWLFVTCSVVFVVVSLMTPAPDEELVQQYCWGNPIKALTAEPLRGAGDPRILSLLLAVTMAALYYTFQ